MFVILTILLSCLQMSAYPFFPDEPEDKPVLYYIYDPLCGWCYGFSPVIQKVQQEYNPQLKIRVISGGMVRGSRVAPLSTIAPYIQGAYKDVEKLSGVQFGAPYLAVLFGKGDRIMDSHPPSVLHTYLSEQLPDRATEISSRIQNLIYQDGLDPASPAFRQALADSLKIDAASLEAAFQSAEFQQKTDEGYRLCEKLGITGYPAVIMYKNNTWYLVSKGWTDFASISQTINSILQSKE
jgi:putative protein-disulfide isomerase